MFKGIGRFFRTIIRWFKVYFNALRDKRTPNMAKFLVFVGVVYLVLPWDILPDAIPGIGLIDDITIIPLLFYQAVKMIPLDVLEEHKHILE